MGEMRSKPFAVFMAFGTKGDVYPLAAVAAAFACDQEQYHVAFITHSAHESLSQNLLEKRVAYIPVSSPPTLSPVKDDDTADIAKSFSLEKRKITREHRQECSSIFERIFADGLSLENDVVVINFFALDRKAGALQNFMISAVLLLLLMLFLTVPIHHLNVTFETNSHIYTSILKKLLLPRFAGMMLFIGCGRYLQKIGDRGDLMI